MSGSIASLWSTATFAISLTLVASAHAETLQLPMADGTTLATDVWRPSDSRKHATLLRRTPYGRAFPDDFAQKKLREGYVVVSQDVRGRGDSQGEFLPFHFDAADGRATIDWIAAQPWSDGKVGTFSASAEGIVQFLAMSSAPPALRCARIEMASHDVYAAMYPGGAWRTDLTSAWLNGLGAPQVIDVWKAHEVRDAWWDGAVLSRDEMARIAHPVFITGGMFDIFAPDQSRIASLLPRTIAPGARNDVFVTLGPWGHMQGDERQQGQLFYPADATLPSLQKDWDAYFAWCLGDGPRPGLPPVRYYLSELRDERTREGAFAMRGEWRESEAWPPADVQRATYYLTPDHGLGHSARAAQRVELALDPGSPLPSVGGGNYASDGGPHEQNALDQRSDVYVATTAPLEEAVELVGVPRAFLWAASASDDVDVIVRFEQVTKEGHAIAFADGIRRGRFVKGDDAIRPLTPGEPTLFEVELGPIALRVGKGHALRVAISGASQPRYEPNPNRALSLASKPTPVATTLSIYLDPANPSRVELPLLRGVLPGVASPTSAEAARRSTRRFSDVEALAGLLAIGIFLVVRRIRKG